MKKSRNSNNTINKVAKKHLCRYCNQSITWDRLIFAKRWIALNLDGSVHSYEVCRDIAQGPQQPPMFVDDLI